MDKKNADELAIKLISQAMQSNPSIFLGDRMIRAEDYGNSVAAIIRTLSENFQKDIDTGIFSSIIDKS